MVGTTGNILSQFCWLYVMCGARVVCIACVDAYTVVVVAAVDRPQL